MLGPNLSICAMIAFAAAAAVSGGRARADAPEWSGPFTISPVSAPQMVLEPVGASLGDGTIVSIGKPTGQVRQRWLIEAAGDGSYAIRAAAEPKLVLAAKGGGRENGTQIVLETDTRQPWQRWIIRRNRDTSWLGLTPVHAPDKGLDDFGGDGRPGARQDLWDYSPMDEHLQWTLTPLPGATYPADLPRPGRIERFTFTESAIFPGTRREVTVYIPARYDGATPACVYVRQDGFNPVEQGMLDALIASGDMPVTVGIFVTPGDCPAPMPNTIGRRNRGLEYDGVGDLYVRFLTEELLPYVERTLHLKLSHNGKDRCIAGGSSGGIAAFNAAWQRPDAFSRVYANSGSFVAFRGGNEFPTLVRKTEPKPIRVFLTTGTHDMENCAGDWYLLDQEMEKALRFSGYEYVFHALEGPHGTGWNEYFAEAMRFLWKGWPEPVHAGPGAPRVQDILVPGEGWAPVLGAPPEARSAASNSKGEVFFLSSSGNEIDRIGLDGRVTVFARDAGRADGVAVGPADEVYTVSMTTGVVRRYEPDGRTKVVTEGVRGRSVAAMADGSLYISGPAARDADGSAIWLVKDGKKREVANGLKRATGLAARPDRWLLQVADGASKWVYSFRIGPDGALLDWERYFWLHVADQDDDAGPEGICYAREGQMFVGTRMGIQVCADDGPTQVILPMPDGSRVYGVCLGGPNGNTLYAFCGNRIWKRTVKTHGVGAFSPWVSMRASPL